MSPDGHLGPIAAAKTRPSMTDPAGRSRNSKRRSSVRTTNSSGRDRRLPIARGSELCGVAGFLPLGLPRRALPCIGLRSSTALRTWFKGCRTSRWHGDGRQRERCKRWGVRIAPGQRETDGASGTDSESESGRHGRCGLADPQRDELGLRHRHHLVLFGRAIPCFFLGGPAAEFALSRWCRAIAAIETPGCMHSCTALALNSVAL